MVVESKKYGLFSKTKADEFKLAHEFNPRNPLHVKTFIQPDGEEVEITAVAEGIERKKILGQFPNYHEYEDTIIIDITNAVEKVTNPSSE